MLFGMNTAKTHPDTTSASAMGPLGALMAHVHPTYGFQIYRQCKNGAGAQLAKGLVTDFDASSSESVAAGAAATERAYSGGIPQVDVPTAHYFWALVWGDGLIKSNGAFSTNDKLVVIGSGKVDTLSSEDKNAVIAQAQAAATGADEQVRARIFIFG